ncbi:ORF42 [Silurid herpesvirus 1]|nr:ORF42 [Silurid herpesvirus 1]
MGSFGDQLAVAYRAAAMRSLLYQTSYQSSSGLQSGGEKLRFTPLESTVAHFPFSTAGAARGGPISQPRMGQQYQQQQQQQQQPRETPRVLTGSEQQHRPTPPVVQASGTPPVPSSESASERKRGGTGKRTGKSRTVPKFQHYQDDDDDIAAADESALLFQAM